MIAAGDPALRSGAGHHHVYFLMDPEASSAQQARMMFEPEDRFPQQNFLMGDGNFLEYEKSIPALLDHTGAAPPEPEDVTEVVEFFQAALARIERWKPS